MFPKHRYKPVTAAEESFQSPFSGDFLCFKRNEMKEFVKEHESFQSPFSGDFLCFMQLLVHGRSQLFPFNLHFQETFFVSGSVVIRVLTDSFQSPFSGDFLCFLGGDTISSVGKIFQSPFSGDFLCFGA